MEKGILYSLVLMVLLILIVQSWKLIIGAPLLAENPLSSMLTPIAIIITLVIVALVVWHFRK